MARVNFADRDQLLAAVTVRAHERLLAEVRLATDGMRAPADRLAAMARVEGRHLLAGMTGY